MTKNLRDELKSKVSESLQTTEFKLLLNLIKENNIESVDELKSYVDTKIGALSIQIKENHLGTTNNDTARALAKEVDLLKSIKDQFFKFL